jgi:Ca2+-binding RTX toxin-like protein
MTVFVISSASETAQSLANGEYGVITSAGSIVSLAGSAAISVAGNFRLTIDGMVLGNLYGIEGDGSLGRINVGTNGYVSGQAAGISGTSANSFEVSNAGLVEGRNYGVLSSTALSESGHNLFLTNTGTITSGGYGVYASIVGGDATINNSGTIIGSNAAIFVFSLGSSSQTSIMNSGVIQASGPNPSAIFIQDGAATIVNSGTINGIITIGGTSSHFTNSGTINGNIYGSSGTDIFTFAGGTIAGTVFGGAGDDQYNVDVAGLILLESTNGGLDGVISSVSYTLGTNFENLSLTGTASINGTGNNQVNSIGGNSADNTLRGAGGNDTLLGGEGIDTLIGGTGSDLYFYDEDDRFVEDLGAGTDEIWVYDLINTQSVVMADNIERLISYYTGAASITGNATNNFIQTLDGNDTLNGVTGADTLDGGAGNDTYITDGGDSIIDSSGVETVLSSASFTLATGLENLTLTGTSSISGTGNAGGNSIIGNAGANSLDGAGGSDTMTGGAGNDTFTTDGGDILNEAANGGTDTVRSSVTFTLLTNFENLVLTGSSAINGTGNSAINTITGNGAVNTLNGSTGSDTMTGGLGNDSFVFNTTLGTSNIDRITDYTAVNDTFRLENAVFTGLATGTLSGAAYVQNTTGKAVDASDRIIYETDTGKVFFDRDGTGAAAAVQFATIGTNLVLTSADFVVF